MFTARAEYRILLRQDNADERLTKKGYEIGLAEESMLKELEQKTIKIEKIINYLKKRSIEPNQINEYLEAAGTSRIDQKLKAISIAARPQIKLKDLLNEIANDESGNVIDKNTNEKIEDINEIYESAEIKIKYEGYIQREKLVAEKIKRLDNLKIPEDIKYDELLSISTEGRQKLTHIKPGTIGQAGRISGVSPSDINILLMYLGR
jgi:tRNA uridine 5-carboxymethylaminomethyl modification enzyme